MRRRPHPALIGVVIGGSAVACTMLDDGLSKPLVTTQTQAVVYPDLQVCRGTCYPAKGTYVDMNGNVQTYDTFRCVDWEYHKVNSDSRIGTTSCRQVAQCIADGLCAEHFPAVLPVNGAVTADPDTVDGYGQVWMRAKVEINRPARYFLEQTYAGNQSKSTYDATSPQDGGADPSVALGGKAICDEPVEKVSGTTTCDEQAVSNPKCEIKSPVTPITNATARCHSDEQIDEPRQWFHFWGDLPSNIPDDAHWEFDATTCVFGVVGAAAGIVGAIDTGGWSLWLAAAGAAPAAIACIPTMPEEQPTTIDVYKPGNAWNSFPGGGPGSGESTTDITGEICERYFEFKWMHTETFVIYSMIDGWPHDHWSIVGRAESHERYPSGGSLKMRGTEPCTCREDGSGSEFGLDCSSFPSNVVLDKLNGWVITDNSKTTAQCDFRGCECGLGPTSYTGEAPPEPCQGSGSDGSGSGTPPPEDDGDGSGSGSGSGY